MYDVTKTDIKCVKVDTNSSNCCRQAIGFLQYNVCTPGVGLCSQPVLMCNFEGFNHEWPIKLHIS